MLRRFHDVEPLAGLEMMSQSELSVLVVSKSLRTVPYPLLGENTMVLSDSMILAPDEQGRLALMFRCAAACSPPPGTESVSHPGGAAPFASASGAQAVPSGLAAQSDMTAVARIRVALAKNPCGAVRWCGSG